MIDFASAHVTGLIPPLCAAVRQPRSEFQIATLISRCIQSDLTADTVNENFALLVEPLLNVIPEQLATLSVWFEQCRFAAPTGAVSEQHSNLNFVIEQRQGIPISLSMLLIEAGRRCGFDCFGVNFPGHFLVSMDQHIVDPLTMQVIDSQALRDRGVNKAQLVPATPEMIALRMLNNLKALQVHNKALNQALAIVDVQLQISDGKPELAASLYFERAEYWLQLGAQGAARDAFMACAEICPYPQLTQQALERADKLQNRSETWH